MRAFSQSRCAVRSDTPIIAAISTNEKPQKNFRSTMRASRASVASSSSSASLRRVSSTGVGHRLDDVGGDRGDLELPATLLRLAAPRVVDDEPPHDPGRVSHEAVAVGKCRALTIGNVEIRLVQKRSRAKRDTRAAPRELASGHTVQLVVQRGEQRISGVAVALFGGGDEGRKSSVHENQALGDLDRLLRAGVGSP